MTIEFEVNIRSGNAVFDEQPRRELARIIEELAGHLRDGGDISDGGKLFDVNGNSVGTWFADLGDGL